MKIINHGEIENMLAFIFPNIICNDKQTAYRTRKVCGSIFIYIYGHEGKKLLEGYEIEM